VSKFLTFDIGCIECGESSDVVGIYETREQAEQAQRARAEGDSNGNYFSGGQHRVEVFEL
jgi:hypothetical protein